MAHTFNPITWDKGTQRLADLLNLRPCCSIKPELLSVTLSQNQNNKQTNQSTKQMSIIKSMIYMSGIGE